MRKIEQDDSSYYSNNQLNLGFIADNSKQIDSMSASGSVSERESISNISRRVSSKSSEIPGSPFFTFDPQISNMEEWPNENPHIFGQKNPDFRDMSKKSTRNQVSQPIEEINEEERELEKMSKCTKKRIGDKNKIITIRSTSNQYQLRSKVKTTNTCSIDNESSSEQIRQMVAQIDSNKSIPKNPRKMFE